MPFELKICNITRTGIFNGINCECGTNGIAGQGVVELLHRKRLHYTVPNCTTLHYTLDYTVI